MWIWIYNSFHCIPNAHWPWSPFSIAFSNAFLFFYASVTHGDLFVLADSISCKYSCYMSMLLLKWLSRQQAKREFQVLSLEHSRPPSHFYDVPKWCFRCCLNFKWCPCSSHRSGWEVRCWDDKCPWLYFSVGKHMWLTPAEHPVLSGAHEDI